MKPLPLIVVIVFLVVQAYFGASLATASDAAVNAKIKSLSGEAAEAYQKREYKIAESRYTEALSLIEKQKPLDELSVSVILNNLGATLIELGKLPEAQAALKKSYEIRLRLLGNGHPSTVLTLKQYARLLRKAGREDAAVKLEKTTISTQSVRTYSLAVGNSEESSEGRSTRRRIEKVATGVVTGIRKLIIVGESDLDVIRNPTTAQREVFDHYERHYVTKYDSFGNRTTELELVPVYRTETYSISEKKDLNYVRAIEDVASRYGTSKQTLIDLVEDGGSVLELDNGMLVTIAKYAHERDWNTGTKIRLQPHPRLELPYVALTNIETGQSMTAEVVAAN